MFTKWNSTSPKKKKKSRITTLNLCELLDFLITSIFFHFLPTLSPTWLYVMTLATQKLVFFQMTLSLNYSVARNSIKPATPPRVHTTHLLFPLFYNQPKLLEKQSYQWNTYRVKGKNMSSHQQSANALRVLLVIQKERESLMPSLYKVYYLYWLNDFGFCNISYLRLWDF